ncbi:hypothetical protein DESA109040_21910 [Deinococcus saxicola]|uniref:DUF1963 domain-containing protein n=1 Tax=Deinococcus saxicola TaxID=249406 RepID=UPI0039F0AEAD
MSRAPDINIHDLRLATMRRLGALGLDGPSRFARALTPAIFLHGQRGGQPRGTQTWPVYDGQPMVFLLAVCLADVRPFDQDAALPAEGWLNFFVAPSVSTHPSPLDACAVIHVPDAQVSDAQARPTLPPRDGLCFSPQPLTFTSGLHSALQDYEFGSADDYAAAFAEWEALDFSDGRGDEEAGAADTDYLLGKQIYGTEAGLETPRDLGAFYQQRFGLAPSGFRALLTLRRAPGDAAHEFISASDSVMSLTFFIEAQDLQAAHFGRVLVDVTVD